MDEDELVQIILGRPFLATARAVIDVHEGKLSLRVQSETVTFNIRKSMKPKHSHDDYLYCVNHTAKMIQEQWVDIVSHDRKWAEEEEEDDSNKVHVVSFYPRTETIKPLEWKALENRLKPSSVEPPKLELKELLEVLKNHKGTIAWSITDIKGIDSSFCTHKILMEDEFKPSVQPQRRVNPNIKEVVKKEVIKLFDAGLIYPISDSPWVSHVQVVPKKRSMTLVKNEKDELIPQRMVTGWCVCIDYRKLNNATRKDHFLLPFIDQMLKRLAGHEYYCFLNGFLGYFQIPIALEDQEKTIFTCPYGTFAYKRMPFRLCNAPATFQRCMIAIFHELVKDCMEIRDKKGAKNLAANHLSRLENPDLGKLTKAEIRDLFPKERLMEISNKNNEPWYADYASYLASRVLPFRSTRQEKQKFFCNLRHYFWDEPFLYKQYVDRIIRRYVARDEAAQILRQCHSEPSRGHHGIATTARKVFEAGFYWPHIFRDARKLVQVWDACQQAGNISLKDETSQKYIQFYEIFDV
ncbi:reverse transcriptase domain-containing protein [Tanacetum coccineum]|uniref:Reverse transcriptase domain-containing protein n=1 Tax=Tanacetum coccineum TaxID=301880 RepID=A0ABQ4XTR3_9ASTR